MSTGVNGRGERAIADRGGDQHPGGPGMLELVRIDAEHWVVHDSAYPASDARHVVACLHEMDHDIDVVWLIRSIPLPTRYRESVDVIEDLIRWRQGPRGATRPVDIAGRRPLR